MFLSGMRSLLKQSLGLGGLVCLTVGLAGAQDTSFAQGPQYMAPAGSGSFSQSIATPSMAVDGTYPSLQMGASNATLGNAAGADLSTIGMQPEGDVVDLFTVYYGYPPLDLVAGQSEYPGEPIVASRGGMRRVLTVDELRRMGYGVTLGEAARYWKTNASHAKRVYTNDDIQRITKTE